MQLSLLLVFWNLHTSSSSHLYGRSFSIDSPVPLRDGYDYKRSTQTICQVSTTTRVRICIHATHSAMGNDKGAHCQLEAHGNVIFYPLFRGICRGIRTLNAMRRVIHRGPYSTYHAATTWPSHTISTFLPHSATYFNQLKPP